MANRIRTGIVLFPDVEVLDYCGPFEVLSSTRIHPEKRREEPSPFEVLLIAQSTQPITTTGGMRVLPDVAFASCPPLDIVIVPGGWGTRREMQNDVLVDWVRERAATASIVASVCTGALVLGSAGVLRGLRATTHWQSLDRLAHSFPDVIVDRTRHFIRDGNVFTSAGISAGIDMSLKLVESCVGEDVARATARYMEYPYPESDARRIAL